MNLWNRLLLVGASAAVLSACGSSSTDNRLALRVIHASPDAPEVNVLIDGAAVLSAVDYKEGSGFLELQRGTYDIEVEAITPAGNVVVIDLPATPLARRTDYSVLAIGRVAGGTLAPLILANDTTQVSAGQARTQVVHGAPSAPPVVVYVTAPGASLAGVAPLGSFSFGEDLGPVEVPGGNYQIRVAPASAPGTVVFDSGTVSLPAGADLLIVAVDNTTTGPSPITLLVNDGSTQFELLDAAAPGDIRVGHFSPDAPAVDVVVNDDFASPPVTDLTYQEVTPYLSLEPDAYNFKVVDSATQSLTAIDLDATLVAGTRVTVLAVNTLAAPLEPLVLANDNLSRAVATEARVRIVHASPAAGPVDVYVAAPGTDVTGISPALANVPFKAETGFIALAPASYEVTITPPGQPNVVAFQATLDLAGGNVFTVIARDAPGGGAPVGINLIDETI